jgi:guanylate kinase
MPSTRQCTNVFIIAAPSGTGKTTLVKALVDDLVNVTKSISYTTRQARPGEVNGKNYFFITKAQFHTMIAHNDFLEYATVFKELYGTAHSFINEIRQQGFDVILEIDWQGMKQVKALLPDSISIFVLPPSLENLQERLARRDQDNANVIAARLSDAQHTIAHIKDFDFVVLNDDFNHALRDLKLIIQASRLRRSCQLKQQASLIKQWLPQFDFS